MLRLQTREYQMMGDSPRDSTSDCSISTTSPSLLPTTRSALYIPLSHRVSVNSMSNTIPLPDGKAPSASFSYPANTARNHLTHPSLSPAILPTGNCTRLPAPLQSLLHDISVQLDRSAQRTVQREPRDLPRMVLPCVLLDAEHKNSDRRPGGRHTEMDR